MLDFSLLIAVIIGVILLFVLILKFKIQAFISLLISSICVGVLSGMSPLGIIKTIQIGMGNTLGFVAVVIGLGAIFGAILEKSGGAESLAIYLFKKFGEKRATWVLMITGFVVAIPVFFDVAFIILIPMIYALQRKTKKSLLLYGIPLLAGLAITHSFIPPTPGPIAVADILQADLGWVILFGGIVGVPTAVICGPIFGNFIAQKIHIDAPKINIDTTNFNNRSLPPVGIIVLIISVPIVLIVANTVLNSPFFEDKVQPVIILEWLGMLGHPFTALIIANLIAWYALGIRKGFSRDQLLDISSKSLAPAGVIILITGAGGVFKQMLVETGAGEMMAKYFTELGVGVLFFGFLSAAIVRVLQGSATVAMITSAGLVFSFIPEFMSEPKKALLVISIASGASILSHVNDSGFWLVGKYLRLNEKQTFMSWSMMTTILSLVSILVTYILSFFV